MTEDNKEPKKRYIPKRQKLCIPKSQNRNIPKELFDNYDINFKVYSDFFSLYPQYESEYIEYYYKWLKNFDKLPRLAVLFCLVEQTFPYSGIIFIFALLILTSMNLEEKFMRRLSAIFIGMSGLGKDIISVFPTEINGKPTILKKFDSTTIKGLENRLQDEPDIFKHKVHVYSDLTTLQTFAKNLRNAWFNYYNKRLETDEFDDRNFFSKQHNKELKKGIISLLATCTADYILRLKYNSKEGLTETTFWDRLIFVNFNLNQDQIDMSDAFTSFRQANLSTHQQEELYKPIKDILLCKNLFNVMLNNKFLPNIMKLRSCVYFSKDYIHENSEFESDTDNNELEAAKNRYKSTTAPRRSKEQIERLIKSIALLRHSKLKNTEVTQDDVDLCKALLPYIYIKPNKFWKVYLYLLLESNTATKQTFTESTDPFYRLSYVSTVHALNYLEANKFIRSEEKPITHQKVYFLNEYQNPSRI